MKIAVASDLHLEFGDLDFDNSDGADVLILSGDILVVEDLRDYDANNIMGESTKSQRWHQFMQRCSERFPYVIYVLGNHEHYHGNFSKNKTRLVERLAYLPNVHVLERDVKVIDDVTFIGGTLWTDMNHGDQLTMYHMRTMMNDFRVIWYEAKARRFSPQDAFEEHFKFKQYISTVVEGKADQKFVVCGHHAPSHLSIHPRYGNDQIMNGGYYSDLSEFILDRPQICLWTHGHTHHAFDYTIGETRVVCNPRGYIGHEPEAANWTLKTVTI
jgi:Icc-related predicted phosphoesterase